MFRLCRGPFRVASGPMSPPTYTLSEIMPSHHPRPRVSVRKLWESSVRLATQMRPGGTTT